MIFPAAFSVGVSPDSGPSLIFITLPNVFNEAFASIPVLGWLVSLLFYILLSLAALTSLMSLLVIFLLLYHEFKDARESGVVMINLPLALIGGVFILCLTSGEISIPAIIGFISLFGIATRNGMLLISHYTQLRSEGMALQQAVVQGSLDRLNPILMTALSSALALIPLAVNGDLPGNEIQSPMATVILGGLLSSTFLNGFIIPIIYLLMNKEEKQTC